MTLIPGPIVVGGGAGGGVFVFRPGGAAADNVYNDWSALMADVGAIEGRRTIQFDDSLGAITIPSGSWDMSDVRWFGVPANPGGDSFPLVSISEGAELPGLRWITGLDIANNATATSPVQIPTSGGATDYFRFDGGAQVGIGGGGQKGTGTVPFILDSAGLIYLIDEGAALDDTTNGAPAIRIDGGGGFLQLYNGATLFGGAVDVATPATCFINADPTSNVADNSVTGTGTISFDTSFINAYLRLDRDASLNTSTTRNATFGKVHRQDTTAAACTVTLPEISDLQVGRFVGVANEDGGNTVTIEVQSGDRIDGEVNASLQLSPKESAILFAVEPNYWLVLATERLRNLIVEAGATAGDRTAVRNTITRVDTTAGDVTITLPTGGKVGDQVAVDNEEGANNVIVAVEPGDVLDGATNGSTVIGPSGVITFVWDGVNEWVLQSRSWVNYLNVDDTGDLYIRENPSLASQLDVVASGRVIIQAQANTLQVLNNRYIFNGQARAQNFDLGESHAYALDAVRLREGQTGVVLDADADSRIFCSSDDVMDFVTNNVTQFSIRAAEVRCIRTFVMQNGQYPETAGQSSGTLVRPWDQVTLAQNGTGLVLDTDGDTYIVASVDDEISLYAGAVEALVIGSNFVDYTGNTFRPATGVTSADLGDIIRPWDQVYCNRVRSAAAGGLIIGSPTVPAGAVYIQEAGTGLVLDADGDTSLRASADDNVQLSAGGQTVYLVTPTTHRFFGAGFNEALRITTTEITTPGASPTLGSLSIPFEGLYLEQAAVGLVLDADGDSVLSALADDNVELRAGSTTSIELVGSGNVIRYELGSINQFIMDTASFRPSTAGGVDLGTLALPFGALYMQEGGTGIVLDADGDTWLAATADDDWRIQTGVGTQYVRGSFPDLLQVVASNATQFSVQTGFIRVAGSGNQDFAESNRRIRDVYLRGGIVHEDRGASPTVGVGDVYVHALDNVGTLEYRAAFNGVGQDYLLIDENGAKDARKITFDADGDTFIESQADDVLAITASGSYVAAALLISSTNVTIRRNVIAGISGTWDLGSVSNSWNRLFLSEGTSALTLDNDGDTWIGCTADDQIQVHIGASRKLTWTVGTADFENLSSVRPANNGQTSIGSDFRGWTALFLASEGAWTTDINDVAPTQPNSQGAVFVAESPDGIRELWVYHSSGEPRRLDMDDGVLSIEGAVGSAPGGAYGTSGIEYLEFRQGQADTIEFQIIAHGNFTVEVAYAMSAANTGDIDLRLDALAVGDGANPNAALTTGTVTTFVPGNDTNRHTAASANFDVAAAEGDVVRLLMERPATDTHTGDVRVLDIRIRAR